MISEQYRNSRIEALILASPEPLPARKITQIIEETTPTQVVRSVAELNSAYADTGSSFRIRQVAGGFQFYILPEYIGLVEELFTRRRKMRLTRAALETVAIIAYRQPTTKTEIEHIRGVASDGVIRTLLERNLIAITGRARTVGKPLQYGTTDEFLKLFGLASLEDLPQMSEIEQMISAAESRDQTELQLEMNPDGKLVKLNVADGTFDPLTRMRDDKDSDDALDEPGGDNGDRAASGGRLVLIGSAESDSDPDDASGEDEVTADKESEVAVVSQTEVVGTEKDS
jgi:segregation and condensation protein B